MMAMPVTRNASKRQELIKAKLAELAAAAKSMLFASSLMAKTREGLCLEESPYRCLVLQFGAPLLIHPHVLLSALNFGSLFLLDISKLAVNFSESMRAELAALLYMNNRPFAEQDIYLDFRKPLNPQGLKNLIYRLAHLNSIIGVNL